ncbi:MAG: isoaspartyl peptidase/L-asparaginase [Nitrospirae bacterium]|nr:isoaspartyl peptidase/L-asparaginase [Nitrospirota bacterium]
MKKQIDGGKTPVLLFHCGTGSTMSPEGDDFLETMSSELEERLQNGEPALDLAVLCVERLEASGLYNAGKGAVPQSDGVVRRDAGAMDGRTLAALGISQVRGIPAMARLVEALLGRSAHVHLSGAMVERWARRHGWVVDAADEAGDPTLIWDRSPGQAGEGTVGCVVRDGQGDLAAVTSTGGIGRMWPGRIGDSPIVGGGFYADNEQGAISMTGVGEAIMKAGGGAALLALLAGSGDRDPNGILIAFFDRILKRFSGEAGAVGIDREGRPFAAHSSSRMVHGLISEGVRQTSETGPGFFGLF